MSVNGVDAAQFGEIGGALKSVHAGGAGLRRNDADGERALVEIPNHFAGAESHDRGSFHLILGESGFQGFGQACGRHAYADLTARQAEGFDFGDRFVGGVIARFGPGDSDDNAEARLVLRGFGVEREG